MKYNLAIYAMVPALLSTGIYAQESTQPSPPGKKWGASIGIDYSRNAYDSNSYLAERNLAASATITYNLNDNTQFSALISGRHSFDGERGDYWDDFWLTATRRNLWTPTDNLSMSVGGRVLIPISDTSVKNDLQTAIRGDVKFTLVLDHWLSGLTVSDAIRLRKNFHQYTTAGGHPLEEYRFSNLLTVDYTKAKWFFSTNFVSAESWSYRGTRYSPKLTYAAEIGYQITTPFSAALGMTNSATYYDPDRGPSPLNDLFDLEKPTYYITLNYTL
ncbi:hypothetical protein [Photobacterium atrarenae]|uniref:Outer membrane receptor protein n=1 Tax=Photobacterium atrarenae TaxID=865757 RepID=A0ABY5GDN4_9GAMM|nr:hypothetical protein [Photobacterium atrarenae]UTV27350.1 hypothetical protein NNL38_13620 [Photobacterium atrarenae]